jgi:predicted flap endonuclease-1-like 5' DNA nuclease
MNWLSLTIGVLIGWIVEWLLDVFYWRRRASDGGAIASKTGADLAAAQSDSDSLRIQLGRQAECERLLQESQTSLQARSTELADLRARLARQDSLEQRLQECEGYLSEERTESRRLRAELSTSNVGVGAASRPQAVLPVEVLHDEKDAVRRAGAVAAGSAPVGDGESVDQPPAPALGGTSTASVAALQDAGSRIEPVVAESAEDDLVVIEGIGPKIAGVLKQNGIRTFATLAAADVSTLQTILRAAGSRYQMANPASWPRQAHLAASGMWDELKALQASLNAGRDENRS